MCDIRIESILRSDNSKATVPYCVGGQGRWNNQAYYKADEFFALCDVLEKIVHSDDTTTVGDIRRLIEDYEAIRFDRQSVNKFLRDAFVHVHSPFIHRGGNTPMKFKIQIVIIETKWASLMAYGLSVDLLKDVLPVNASLSAETVRQHLHKTAARQEESLQGAQDFVSGCPNVWERLPKPDKPLTVGIDGGYVKDCRDKKMNFEVIVGKCFSKSRPAKRMGFVQELEGNPRRRLRQLLDKQGMQANQQITLLSDGGDTVRNLQYLMHPEAEHVLDWFHVTMRLTVLNQFAKGLAQFAPEVGERITKALDSANWYVWHGNVEKALDKLTDCGWQLEDETLRYSNRKKFLRHIEEMITYIENNGHLIPNYGEKYRYGETITTAFVESTVNEVVAKRMVKKQQMQWSPKGARNVLQTRTAALNDELRSQFETWYPEMKNDAIPSESALELPRAA